jgi:hypothetical protein
VWGGGGCGCGGLSGLSASAPEAPTGVEPGGARAGGSWAAARTNTRRWRMTRRRRTRRTTRRRAMATGARRCAGRAFPWGRASSSTRARHQVCATAAHPPSSRSSQATAAMGLSPSRWQQERPVPAHASHLLSANNRGERPFALMQQLAKKEGLEFIGAQVWTRSSARSTSWAATTRETSRLSPSLVASSEMLKGGLQPRLRRLARRTPCVECSLADFVGRANGHLKGLWTTASALC